jgi:hypothetical protein
MDRYEKVMLFTCGVPLDTQQSRKVNALIQKQCCNHSQGCCEMLDNGTPHKCIQINSDALTCSWFKEALLPLDSLLEVELTQCSSKTQHLKKCAVCGKTIVSKSNKLKYCNKCALKTHRKQQVEYKHRKVGSLATNRALL